MDQKILLIEPPFHRLFKETYSLDRYPLALGYLAGAIQQETDWQVRTYNADFTPRSEQVKVSYLAGTGFASYQRNLQNPSAKIWQEIHSVVERHRPDVVGISAKSQNFTSACIVAELVKQVCPECLVVLGGAHASMIGPDVLLCPHIDLGVQGEGEATIVELLGAIQAGADTAEVPGVLYRRAGQRVAAAKREPVADLDSLAWPHASAPETLIDHGLYPPTAFQYVFATRGCPFNCFFCGSRNIWSRKVRFRSPDNVIAELQQLQKLGLRFVHFDDDTFGVTRKHLRELCDAISTGCPGLKWSCEIHVNLVDEQTIAEMKQAGCYRIQIGIESGCDEILRAMRKGFTIAQARAACDIIQRQGLELHAFFMVGFPQETEETLAQTAQAMRDIAAGRVLYSIFTPYPGTEAYEYCQNRGLIGQAVDLSKHFHQSPENCFCENISHERFRQLVTAIERTCDRRNARRRMREIFSRNSLTRLRQLGPGKAIRKAWRVLRGK
ncbi:MAG: hypothetical protein DRP83_09215 [Planctomycetota bacterium]|nr:MAG: hypothetical protein DRP83_09215 [Planctomycetota bacterium]